MISRTIEVLAVRYVRITEEFGCAQPMREYPKQEGKPLPGLFGAISRLSDEHFFRS
jgi:hypothetical protein